jgi:hypothetical protein
MDALKGKVRQRSVAWMRVLMGTMLAIAFGLAGCGVHFAHLPPGSVAGRIEVYDYSPSVIQSGNLQQVWWCGGGYNPSVTAQWSDTIQYESIDLSTHTHSAPVPVLGETPGAWDSLYVCNPKVVRGIFANPLGNNETFSYAMYYVGLGSAPGANNSIGVAFSNDGISWKKYPQPVILAETQDNYGVGQPAAYNVNLRGAIRLFYEDDSYYQHHVAAISNDGVHFTVQGTITPNGLDPNSLAWGDMAYNPNDGSWYAGYNTIPRDPSTTGGVVERGSYGISLYRIPDASLLTGAIPWELLTTIDTSLNGYEANFLPGFVRDIYGNLITGSAIQMFTSVSNPPPPWDASPGVAGLSGDVQRWNISSASWTPGYPLVALNRYFNQTTYEVTTGWIDPNAGFSLQSTLGHLYESPQQGATLPLYSCKLGSMDYFISRDSACERYRVLGTVGYGYSGPVAGLNLVPLYRCKTGAALHFVSTDPNCEGQETNELLGYARP